MFESMLYNGTYCFCVWHYAEREIEIERYSERKRERARERERYREKERKRECNLPLSPSGCSHFDSTTSPLAGDSL